MQDSQTASAADIMPGGQAAPTALPEPLGSINPPVWGRGRGWTPSATPSWERTGAGPPWGRESYLPEFIYSSLPFPSSFCRLSHPAPKGHVVLKPRTRCLRGGRYCPSRVIAPPGCPGSFPGFLGGAGVKFSEGTTRKCHLALSGAIASWWKVPCTRARPASELPAR